MEAPVHVPRNEECSTLQRQQAAGYNTRITDCCLWSFKRTDCTGRWPESAEVFVWDPDAQRRESFFCADVLAEEQLGVSTFIRGVSV